MLNERMHRSGTRWWTKRKIDTTGPIIRLPLSFWLVKVLWNIKRFTFFRCDFLLLLLLLLTNLTDNVLAFEWSYRVDADGCHCMTNRHLVESSFLRHRHFLELHVSNSSSLPTARTIPTLAPHNLTVASLASCKHNYSAKVLKQTLQIIFHHLPIIKSNGLI